MYTGYHSQFYPSGFPYPLHHGYGGRFTTAKPTTDSIYPTFQDTEEDRLNYLDLQWRRKQMPEDVLLDYTWIDKGLHRLKTALITTPKTIWRGLKGEQDFSFSEMMLNAKVPYFLGGLFLTLSPFLGGNKREGIRQGVAVALYVLGAMASNTFINGFYKLAYGVDLGMMYRSQTGQVEKVFASADFPRFDLLTPRHYKYLIKKMGIPPDVDDPDGAVREQLRGIATKSRVLKLLVGNLVSAIGAGYMARSDAWLVLPAAFKTVSAIWKTPGLSFLKRFQQSSLALSAALRTPLLERLSVNKVPLWRKGVVWAGVLTAVASVAYILAHGTTPKNYVSDTTLRSYGSYKSRFGGAA